MISMTVAEINGKKGFPVRYFINGQQMASNADFCEWGVSLEDVCNRLRHEAAEDGFTVESLTIEQLKQWESDNEPQTTIVLKVRR